MRARLIVNGILTLLLTALGVRVLTLDTVTLPLHAAPGAGTTFAGASRLLLAVALFALAGFAAAVARSWLRGDLPAPPPGHVFRPDALYRGRVLARHGWLVLVAATALAGAFALAS